MRSWIAHLSKQAKGDTHPLNKPGPEVIKLFSCSTQLSMEFFLLINVKMPTIVGILTFMSGKNSILGLSELKTSRISWYFYTYEHLKFHAQLSWARKKFYNLGACSVKLHKHERNRLKIKGWSWLLTQNCSGAHLFNCIFKFCTKSSTKFGTLSI